MNELVYGFHVVKSILDKDPKQILKVYISYRSNRNVRLQSLFNQIRKTDIILEESSQQYLTYKVKGALHQGIVAQVTKILSFKEDNLSHFLMTIYNQIPLLLILDGITDPHNLGACLRTAHAAGVHLVIVPRNRSAYVNSTVRKVASGSAEQVPCMRVTNLLRTLQLLKKHNIWVVGTIGTILKKSNNIIFNAKLTGPLALVMGSEGLGMRYLTQKNCDELINIPMSDDSISLNVSVATGICLFEILRQRIY